MAKIYNDILETIGGTPLVRLNRLDKDLPGNVLVKLEFFNPANSVKDRIGKAIVDAAEAAGELKPGGTIVEATSGNTGIALALVGAARGYSVVLTMPGAVDKANEIVAERGNAILARQFANAANPEIHRKTTGEEIWADTDGNVDVFVAGIGTGGTVTGAGEALKKHNPDIKVYAVEPEASPLLTTGKAGPHKIQGLGANFIPEVLNQKIYEEVLTVSNEDAIATSRALSASEGILGGISAGANVKAALELAARPENEGKTIVTVIPDFGERYVSTVLYEDIRS